MTRLVRKCSSRDKTSSIPSDGVHAIHVARLVEYGLTNFWPFRLFALRYMTIQITGNQAMPGGQSLASIAAAF
jgi:hypothetical protein